MTIEIPITIIGRDSVDVFLIEKSFQPFKNVKLFVFNESTVLFKFLLNSNYNKGYILIDTKVDLIYGEEILRKLTKLNLNFKNISISFLYNSGLDIEELVNKVSYEYIYKNLNINYVEKPLTREKIEEYILNN